MNRFFAIVIPAVLLSACGGRQSPVNPGSNPGGGQNSTESLLSEDGKTITYGIYPQTNVNDQNLVS